MELTKKDFREFNYDYKKYKKMLNSILGMREDTMEQRKGKLMCMHDFIYCCINDENNQEPWHLCGVPDDATDEDFVYIAEHIEEYREIKKLFMRIANIELEEYKRNR